MSGEYLYQPKNGKIHGILTQLNIDLIFGEKHDDETGTVHRGREHDDVPPVAFVE